MINENPSITVLPVLAMRGVVIFPKMTLHFDVGRQKSVTALKMALNNDRLIFLVAQKNIAEEEPDFDGLYKIGVVAEVKQLVKLPNSDNVRVVVEGKYRAAVSEVLKTSPMLKAAVTEKPNTHIKKTDLPYLEAISRTIKDMFDDYADLVSHIAPDVALTVFEEKDTSKLTDYIAGNIPLQFEDKQSVLSELNPVKRGEKLCAILAKETELLSLELDIQDKVQEKVDKNQREYYLREQMKVITTELNEDDSPAAESVKFKAQIKKLPIDDKSKKKLNDECDRLTRQAPGSPEATVSRTYIERVLSLPWGVYTKDSFYVEKAKKILDKDHYGLSEVKERILELIAVRRMAPDINAQILCLVGPPGVGKTSIAKSLAKAMGRKYVRISLGGVHDEAEIRGHRRTYIGSMPGRIIAAIEQAGTENPLILLDEIDKLGGDYKGDPSSALLEVLDGEQNNTFCDHYIDVPFDLSKVLFITTANDAAAIPAALYDRMEIIELYSYTSAEKLNIAKKHLIPKQLNNYGMTSKMLKISDDAVKEIIDGYTKEAGVRTLERVITKIMRKAAVKFSENSELKLNVTKSNLNEYLGAKKFKPSDIDVSDMKGAANGLAWTSVGGEMLQIEVLTFDGSGKLELTGSLGDVMKESAKAALSFIRSRADYLGIDKDFYKTKDIHIHVPEGAVPKDGPSAGVTMTTALVSALTKRPSLPDVAMTGEITLRGKVIPIGGLREKSMAAYKNGMKTVLIPEDNRPDLEKVDEVVKEAVEFIPVSTLDEVLSIALTPKKDDGAIPVTVNADKTEEHKTPTVYC